MTLNTIIGETNTSKNSSTLKDSSLINEEQTQILSKYSRETEYCLMLLTYIYIYIYIYIYMYPDAWAFSI